MRRPQKPPQGDDLPTVRPKFRPHEWYRGDPPSAVAQHLLDNYLIHFRNEEDLRHLRPGKYFVREVERANQLAAHWGWALMDGWTYDDIIKWTPTGMPVEHAIAIKGAGVDPAELRWHYDDQGRGDLRWRLMCGTMTVDEVILEALARRERA